MVANSVEMAIPLRPITTRHANKGANSRTIARHNMGATISVVIPIASTQRAAWTINSTPTAAPKRKAAHVPSTPVNNNWRDITRRTGSVHELGREAKEKLAHSNDRMLTTALQRLTIARPIASGK